MPKIKIYNYDTVRQQASFHCPACNEPHGVSINRDGAWYFNGDLEKPTFRPSVKAEYQKMTEAGRAEVEKWIKEGFPISPESRFESMKVICHSYVTDGRIQYLDDSTHSLAGQTVDLPDRND